VALPFGHAIPAPTHEFSGGTSARPDGLLASERQSGAEDEHKSRRLHMIALVSGHMDWRSPEPSSRAYFGKNQLTAKGANQLSYIEVTNGLHFDTFIDLLPGFNQLYIPLHV
jgi:hydroxybutyrate-dimer hydrolase